MFALLRTLLWTACAVGFGIFLSTWNYQGRTPLEHAQKAWRKNVSRGALDDLKEKATDAVDRAKDAVGVRPAQYERHSQEDRQELERLIANRGSR